MRSAERDTFVEFVHGSSARLTRLAVLLLGQRQGADDLVQAAYERVLRHWPRLDHDGEPEAYARRILVNLAVDGGRSRTRRPEVLAQPPEKAVWDVIEVVNERMRVLDALRQLPRQQRAVVVLRYYADLTESDIADALGCSVGTVKSTGHRASLRLRDLLGRTPDPAERPRSARSA
ncbi:MAG: SigE family RNA polymerase sigma factor [Mycobacteriales bacterium]